MDFIVGVEYVSQGQPQVMLRFWWNKIMQKESRNIFAYAALALMDVTGALNCYNSELGLNLF